MVSNEAKASDGFISPPTDNRASPALDAERIAGRGVVLEQSRDSGKSVAVGIR
jgi:hypothetical protein